MTTSAHKQNPKIFPECSHKFAAAETSQLKLMILLNWWRILIIKQIKTGQEVGWWSRARSCLQSSKTANSFMVHLQLFCPTRWFLCCYWPSPGPPGQGFMSHCIEKSRVVQENWIYSKSSKDIRKRIIPRATRQNLHLFSYNLLLLLRELLLWKQLA